MFDNMIKLQEIAELKGQVRKLESMLKTETNTSNEYWQRLQKYVSNDPDVAGMEARSTFGGASHHPMIEQLENELKIQQITNGDLFDEANEYVKEIVRPKDEVNSMSSQSALASSGADLDRLKSEIIVWWH